MLAGFICPLWTWLLLWIPVPFYAISMAWGGVPIFIPKWWPFSDYDMPPACTRYSLIPVFAVFWRDPPRSPGFGGQASRGCTKCMVAIGYCLLAWSYYGVWREIPICLREARVNSVDRIAIETKLAAELSQLPPDATLLMYLGEHGGALQEIGFPLKRTINECHKRYWHSALYTPALMADFIVATDGDPIAQALSEHPAEVVKHPQVFRPLGSTRFPSTEPPPAGDLITHS